MPAPFEGKRVLLVDTADEAVAPHAPLRRRALERLGCAVTACDPTRKPGLLARWRGGSVAERVARAIGEAVPDLVLVVEGTELTAAAVTQLRREAAARFAIWYQGAVRTLPLMEATSAAYDAVFVPGSDCAARLRGPSRPPVRYLPPACDPSVHRPVEARNQFRANVVFVGTATPRREQLLGELVEFGLALWGRGWRRTALRDYCRGEQLAAADYVRACAGASVAVNIHDDLGPDAATATGCNARLFELAGIGVPQVVDARDDLGSHFVDGQEVRTYRTGGELRATVQALLEDTKEAQRLAEAARRRALAEHTYMHRVAELLRAVLAPARGDAPAA